MECKLDGAIDVYSFGGYEGFVNSSKWVYIC